jgi:mutator protein MutT
MRSRYIASVLVRHGDEYLFIRQNKVGGAYPDTLHIPGGGIDEGESPSDAAAREVLEEVGLKVTGLKSVGFDWDLLEYKGAPTMLVFLQFTADSASREAEAASDAREVVWVHKSDLSAQPHNPPSIKLLQKLELI